MYTKETTERSEKINIKILMQTAIVTIGAPSLIKTRGKDKLNTLIRIERESKQVKINTMRAVTTAAKTTMKTQTDQMHRAIHLNTKAKLLLTRLTMILSVKVADTR